MTMTYERLMSEAATCRSTMDNMESGREYDHSVFKAIFNCYQLYSLLSSFFFTLRRLTLLLFFTG